jgi:hypothetical protein
MDEPPITIETPPLADGYMADRRAFHTIHPDLLALCEANAGA